MKFLSLISFVLSFRFVIVLTARLGGSVSEKIPPPALPFSGPPKMSRPILLNALRLAADDPRIAHLHIGIDPLSIGWGKIFEMRRHMECFRASGKSITVFLESGGPKEYFVAMGFAVFVPPEGALGLRGFSQRRQFWSLLLEGKLFSCFITS